MNVGLLHLEFAWAWRGFIKMGLRLHLADRQVCLYVYMYAHTQTRFLVGRSRVSLRLKSVLTSYRIISHGRRWFPWEKRN